MSTKYISQGHGRGIVYEALAKVHFQQKGKKPSREQLEEFMQVIADEAMESYIPNPMLGQNPSPKISKNIKKLMEPSDELFAGLTGSVREGRAAKKEISKAAMHLTNVVMKYFFGFRISRESGAVLSDPRQLSDFEHLANTPDTPLTKDQTKRFNKAVMVNNFIRHLVFTHIWVCLMPLALMSKDDVYNLFIKGGIRNIDAGSLYKPEVIKSIIYGINYAYRTPGTKLPLTNTIEGMFNDNWIVKRLKKRKA